MNDKLKELVQQNHNIIKALDAGVMTTRLKELLRDNIAAIEQLSGTTDENGCYTLPNGDCVSEGPCMHTKTDPLPGELINRLEAWARVGTGSKDHCQDCEDAAKLIRKLIDEKVNAEVDYETTKEFLEIRDKQVKALKDALSPFLP